MSKPKIGLVGVASYFESGGERAEQILSSAVTAMIGAGLEVVSAKKVVWDSADAIEVCEQLNQAGIESVAIVDITWVTDSLKYIFIHELNVPTVFWAVPYTETFSIGCVQHFGSILRAQGIAYQYVYGLADDASLIKKIREVAQAGHIISKVKKMRLALLGPRQTWRVAGPQDMTNEEWEFSKKFGPTLIHIEMDEISNGIKAISDNEAEATLKALQPRTGKSLANKETMLQMAKVYMTIKRIIEVYNLDAIAAECYPQFSGLMNLTSSWLADEGVVVDTEGDISHTMVMYMLNLCADGGATVLGEVGSFDGNVLALAHEGSTAHSMAESLDKVQVSPSGEKGSFVGVPVKPMPVVTVSSMVGSAGDYTLLVSKGETLPVTRQQWVDGGSKLLVHLRTEKSGASVIDAMIKAGLDHHLLIKEGDHTNVLSMLCDYIGIKKIEL